jgi:hypothetical protein
MLRLFSLHVQVLSDKDIELFHIDLFNGRYWVYDTYMYVCMYMCVCVCVCVCVYKVVQI